MAKIVFSVGDIRAELEGEEAFVEEKFESLFKWASGILKGEHRPTPEVNSKVPSEQESEGRRTLKTFYKEKAPGNVYEGMAIVLHYKKANEQVDELTGDEIRKSLLQAGGRPPQAFAQALTDCRRRYGYVQTGSKKGMWKLSHQGETLVEIDLPRVNP